MGVDSATYRFRGAGMTFCMSYSQLVKLIGSLAFIRILLVMAGIETNPGPTEQFIFRYQYLLVEIGTKLTRRLFEVKVGHDCVKHLTQTTVVQTLQQMITAKKITPDQAKYLPPVDMKPDSSNFDISLLICLLRNVCGLRQPKDTVWMNPSPTDTSEEADITRIRLCRNWLMHRDTVVLPNAEFDNIWKELRGILIRLNYSCGIRGLSALIDNASKMDTDEMLKHRFYQTLKSWDVMDQDVMSKLDRIEKSGADGHARTVKTVEQGVVTLQQEMQQGMSTVRQEVQHRMSAVQQNVQQGLSTVQQKVQQGFSTVQQGLSSLQHEVQQGFSTLQQGLSSVQQEVTTVKQGLSSVQQDVKQGLSTVQQGLSSVQQEMQQGLSSVQKEVKQGLRTVQQDIKLKSSPTEAAEDLRNRLVKIYTEECCTLSVSPLCDEDDVEILSIYIPPSLYHVPYHRTQEKEKKYSISSYKEIFCKNDLTFRKIYITGDAGVGKTYFCKRMTFLWCKSQCGESVSDKSVQNDIDFMANFDFVFYVSLRDTRRKDVVTMIIEQSFCNENDLKKKEIYECVENILINHRCIIIMDALDEWTPTESGKININKLLSDKCSVVTTCRPYKIENERLSPRDLDRQVQITGIKGSSRKHYITELLKHISMANVDNKEPNDFIRDVSKCGLQGQLRIPIITSHLVAVWYDHKLTDMSRALIYSNIVDMLLKRAEQRKGIELPSWVESKLQFPDSLSELFYFKKHISFLKKICLLSFNLLFKQDKCLSVVVFTTEQLQSEPYCISANEMDFLCKFGILSKSKVIGRFGKREQKLSYLHKTYLEYFAALFVSSFDLDNVFDNIVQKWTTINDVVQFENFFIFFVGLSIHKSKILLENMYHTISDDLSLCRKNAIFHYDHVSYNKQIKSLQSMVINCFKEVGGSNDSFRLVDFIFDNDFSSMFDDDDSSNIADDDDDSSRRSDDDDDSSRRSGDDNGSSRRSGDDDDSSRTSDDDDDSSRRSGDDNGSSRRSGDDDDSSRTSDEDDDSSRRSDDDNYEDDVASVVYPSNDPNILFDENSSVDHLKQILLLNTTCVKSIHSVQGKYYDEFDQIQNLQCLNVGALLSGDYVKFIECMLQNQSTLHTVGIEGRILAPSLIPELPVRSLQHLTSLSLYQVKMPHNSLHNLVTFLSDNVLIENIKLSFVLCDDHTMYDDSACTLTLTLNLLHHTKLSSLYLECVNILCNYVNNSSLKSITLCTFSERIGRCYIDVINCIKYSQLKHLYINGSSMLDNNTMRALSHTVNTLPYIKSLTMWYMKLPDDLLLQLHPDVTQVEIKLGFVTLSRQCFHCFIENCVNNKFVIKVKLSCCSITSVDGETHSVLSEEESVDYMSEYLTSIPTVNITPNDGYSLHFDTGSCQ